MPTQPHPDFGQWLTYAESVRSDTARRKGLSNVPSSQEYQNMVAVYQNLYVPICQRFGKLFVSSFFRSVAVNRAVGGAKKSQHMGGFAIDIDCDGTRTVANLQLYNWIVATLNFDQIILEYPDAQGRPSWVHCSFVSREKNRKQQITVT